MIAAVHTLHYLFWLLDYLLSNGHLPGIDLLLGS